MNERIKELAEQADAYRLDYGYYRDTKNPDSFAVKHAIDLELFAELIVRECAELSVSSQYANTKSEYYEGFNEALMYASNKIKQHFGVEE